METNHCPPINILLNPEQAEDDKRRASMDEHVKHCNACRELRELASNWPKPSPKSDTGKPNLLQFGKLLREVTYTIVHLYRHGIPKCYMVHNVECFTSVVHAMLAHQQAVIESIGPLAQIDREDVANLWVDATKASLTILLLGRKTEKRIKLHHDACDAWAAAESEVDRLIERFDGPCQNPKRK